MRKIPTPSRAHPSFRPQAVAGGLGTRPSAQHRWPPNCPRSRWGAWGGRCDRRLVLLTLLVIGLAALLWPTVPAPRWGSGSSLPPVPTLGPGPSRLSPTEGSVPPSTPGETGGTLVASKPGTNGEPGETAAPEGISLTPEGRPDCETVRELRTGQPPPTGDDVKELQARLLHLGLYNGPVNGVYNEATVDAVRRAQTLAGLPSTGVVGENTWLALYRLGEPLLGERHHKQTAGTHPQRPPAPPGPLSILIDIDKLTLTLFSQGKPFKTYPVAAGEGGLLSSPVGEWKVVNKDRGWGGGFGSRWLGLNVPWGIYGIHGTNKPWSIGTRASHGCFRMFNEDVEELWDWVPLNTPVIVQGDHPRPVYGRTLRPGSSGKDVVGLQFALRRANLDVPEADGRYGPVTEAAVRALQQALGWPVTGKVEADLLHFLGLRPLPQL